MGMAEASDYNTRHSFETRTAHAPGRVNLIGDHTDYTGGFAMPIAIQLGTEVTWLPEAGSDAIELSSSTEPESTSVPFDVVADADEIAMILPEWCRYVAGVVATINPACGGKGIVVADLPARAGLSSSASLEVALALALGFAGSRQELALSCQGGEMLATGVATGILDQMAVASARAGHAMLMDCSSLEVRHVALPPDVQIVAVHCGVARSVTASAYAERVRQCDVAAGIVGPLRTASVSEVDRIGNQLIRRRARHVVSENARVLAFAAALESGDLKEAGNLMNQSHLSLSNDYEVSIEELDQLVSWLQGIDGVFGARMTGAGFGGCAVAISRPGALRGRLQSHRYWIVRACEGARVR